MTTYQPKKERRPTHLRLAGAEGKQRTISIVCSTASVDRYGDTISPTGWELSNYLRNPVLLWGHDGSTPPIGRGLTLNVQSDALSGEYEFCPLGIYPLADTVYALAVEGFINAGSVGFNPIEWKHRDDGIDFTKQELLEMSIVSIPANPDALISARSKGIDFSPFAALPGTDDEMRRALTKLTSPLPIRQFSAAHTIARKVQANVNALRLASV